MFERDQAEDHGDETHEADERHVEGERAQGLGGVRRLLRPPEQEGRGRKGWRVLGGDQAEDDSNEAHEANEGHIEGEGAEGLGSGEAAAHG